MDQSASPSVDGGDYDDDDVQSSKPGRKKGPANAAARRDQNRIAQREFRQRKQQRIRDLEARVEILSGTKEETHFHTRMIIQGLMEENARLRALLRDLGSFMGDGLGGPLLDKTGWTMEKFKDFTARADSDAAYEAFVKAKQLGTKNGESSHSGGMQSPASNEPSGSRNKRKRGSSAAPDAEQNDGPATRRSYSGSVPNNSNNNRAGSSSRRASSPNELQSLLPSHSYDRVDSHPSNFSSLVNTLSNSSGAPFIGVPMGPTAGIATTSALMDPYPNNSPQDSATPLSASSGNADVAARRQQEYQENESKRNEAGKLIKYHLDNFKRNQDYFLPASLRPTLVQRTVEHDPLIDGIIYPEIRDRMILLKDQYDLAKCLLEFVWTTIVHGDDVLAHTNWELGEDWLRSYGFLVEDSVLTSVNKWRRLRGEAELTLKEINPDAVHNN